MLFSHSRYDKIVDACNTDGKQQKKRCELTGSRKEKRAENVQGVLLREKTVQWKWLRRRMMDENVCKGILEMVS